LPESSTDDWEQDFDDVEVTEADLQAAHDLANKLNMSAAEYSAITGAEVTKVTTVDSLCLTFHVIKNGIVLKRYK